MRKKIGQRNNKDNFSEQAEENCSLFLVQRLKHGLSAVLERLEDKCQKIQMQGPGCVLQNRLVTAENPYKPFRPEHDQKPYHKRIWQCKRHHDPDGLFNICGPCGSIVIADGRRCSFRDRKNRRVQNRPHRRNNRHDRHIRHASKLHQNLIAGNLYQRVCKLHDKRSKTQTDDFSGVWKTESGRDRKAVFLSLKETQNIQE